MKVVVSKQAKTDLLEIRRFIARADRAAAKREIAQIRLAIGVLATDNADGRNVVLSTGDSARIWLVSSYRIYYRRQNGELQILRIYHQARRPIER